MSEQTPQPPALPESSPRPRCQHCQEPLDKHHVTITMNGKEPLPVMLHDLVHRKQRHDAVGRLVARIWTGRYGFEGDDRFCSMKCCRAWALKRCMKPGSNKLALAVEALIKTLRENNVIAHVE